MVFRTAYATFVTIISKTALVMKRFFICVASALCLLTSCNTVVNHDQETPISFDQLPTAAQQFINQHYEGVKVKEIIREQHASLMQYEVDLKGGIDLQFDRHGYCTEVNCKNGDTVPDDVIPESILSQIRQRFPARSIVKFEHDSRLYDIDLDDGTELSFNNAMRLIDIDR